MSGTAKFTLSFSFDFTNEERIEMFEFYKKALNAKKISESTPPDSDVIHIMMEIYGTEILIGPGTAKGKGFKDPVCCEVRFTDENEFDKAYEALSVESKSSTLDGPFPWAKKLGLVEDKFGMGWALYYNEA